MKSREIRIQNVPDTTVKELQNIAKNLGTSVPSLIKPKLKEIIYQYPKELREDLG